MAWHITVRFTDGSSVEDSEDYATYEDALIGTEEWLENWATGQEVLQDAGRDWDDRDIDDFDIWED